MISSQNKTSFCWIFPAQESSEELDIVPVFGTQIPEKDYENNPSQERVEGMMLNMFCQYVYDIEGDPFSKRSTSDVSPLDGSVCVSKIPVDRWKKEDLWQYSWNT